MMKHRLFITALSLAAAALVTAGCGPGRPPGEQGGISEGMRFRITADSLPPRAMDRTLWRVTVTDAKTGAPIEGGEGRIWGRNKDGHYAGEGLEAAKELGTYLGTVEVMTAGSWQLHMEFRRNSNSPFGRIDWMQEVFAPRPLGGG